MNKSKSMTMAKRILIIGSGGREHAMAYALSHSPTCEEVLVLPGNPGMKITPKVRPLLGKIPMSEREFLAAVEVFRANQCDLVIIGPENPLAEGITDFFESKGIPCLGPSKAAAQLESSKVFSKLFMQRHNIPTAPFEIAFTPNEALQILRERWPLEHGLPVIKASELWAGKGVVVPETIEEAENTLDMFFNNPASLVKPKQIVFENRLKGVEVSAFALSDGEHFIRLGEICDYKRLNDGGRGPNTGGMGAHTPKEGLLSEVAIAKIYKEIIPNTLQGLKIEGMPFKGFLFVGLMINGDEVNVIEYNVRLGDPETQVLMPLLKHQLKNADVDLVDLFMSAARGNLKSLSLTDRLSSEASLKGLHIVIASEGYPGQDGQKLNLHNEIQIPTELCDGVSSKEGDVYVFFSGVDNEAPFKNSGGRVLGLTATAPTLMAARELAYRNLRDIYFKGMHYRKDIGL